MLILADLSGIQDYLFQLREVGGKQAASLRFRSLYIQLIAEAVGVRLLRAAGLDERRQIFSAAGKVLIDGGDLSPAQKEALESESRGIEHWLLDETQGRLRLNLVLQRADRSLAESYLVANRALQAAKHRPWSGLARQDGGWQPELLVGGALPDPEVEAERDARLGHRITDPTSTHLIFETAASGDSFDVAGVAARLTAKPPNDVPVRDLKRLARHIPRERDGGALVEFVHLAKRARGASVLAVLKADADSLGQAIGGRLKGARDLKPLRNLSEQLEDFFSQDLDREMRDDPRWSSLYTVFSGGDDLLLVGPWDIVLDFTGHLQKRFTRNFSNDRLTISAGVAVMKPKFPIRLAAQQADDLLDRAKTEAAAGAQAPKDQCAAFGQIWKWRDHDAILASGKQLADWVDTGVVQRGWLHTVLELDLLRRGKQPGRDPSMPPVMTASRLAYHIGRNWRPGPQPERRAAREWIDRIAAELDRVETTYPDAIYLPTILRYAMLATRGAEKGDE